MAGDVTHVVDLDEEKLVRHFCLEKECQEVIEWFKKDGHTRPDGFDGRLSLAEKLREKGNEKFGEDDLDAAMMYALSALHCLDFSRGASMSHKDSHKQQVFGALVKIISNLSIVFLKRGDNYNAVRAADLGLDFVKRLPAPSADQPKAKLLYRRGLAKGQTHDWDEAKANLVDAARLMPDNREIRKALENCKLRLQLDRGAPDDKWRGKLTGSPEMAVRSAQLRRYWRMARAGASEVWRLVRQREALRAVAMLLLGPMLSALALMLARRWADGQAQGVTPADAQGEGEMLAGAQGEG